MLVEIGLLDDDDASVCVRESDDFTGFHVLVPTHAREADIDAALKGVRAGHLASDGHAVVNIDWLRAQVPEADTTWNEGFNAMVSYAASRGWLNAAGNAVKAHLEVYSVPET